MTSRQVGATVAGDTPTVDVVIVNSPQAAARFCKGRIRWKTTHLHDQRIHRRGTAGRPCSGKWLECSCGGTASNWAGESGLRVPWRQLGHARGGASIVGEPRRA